MLSRLIWAAARGSKQLSQSGGFEAISQACSNQSLSASTHGKLPAAWKQLWDSQKHALRCYSAETAGQQGFNKTKSILEHAAEAEMRKAKGAASQSNAPPTLASRVFGVLIDSVMLGTVGAAAFAGYYTYAYKDTAELETELQNARQSLGISQPLGQLEPVIHATPPPPPPPGQVLTGPTGPAASEPSSSSSESPAFPPVTRLWCEAMDRYLRARKYVEKSIKDYRDPTYHKLLPDMAPELRGRVKTLVLDLDDLLVHKEWTRQTGWKIYKRPGVQDFLLEMGGYYEVVVYTDATATYAEPILSKLDPHRVVLYKLYRPETQYHNGKHVRDLSKLNRDLSQVLMISANPDAWEFQPENTIKLKPWSDDFEDTTLLDLIPMLQLIATKGVRDVRDVVKSYDGEEDVAKAFKARMAQISQQHKQPKQRGLLTLR